MAEKKRRFRATQRFGGKKYEATGKTQREADRKLAEKIASVRRGEETIGGNMTVDKWFAEWMETYKIPTGICQKWISSMNGTYRNHIQTAIGHMRMSDVKPAHCQKILNSLEGMSHSSASKCRDILSGMFDRARKNRIIVYNPAEDLVMPATTSGKRRALTEIERAKVVQTIKTHKRGLWIMVMLYAGLRPGETAALMWSHVDFERNVIRVVHARESGGRNLKDPKTASGIRDVPMVPALRERLWAVRGEPFSYVFPNRYGNVASEQSMCEWFNSFRKAAGLPEGITAYYLRHSFCSDLQKEGVPIVAVRDLMGHADISTTAGVYSHTDGDMLRQEMDRYASAIAQR